MSKREFTEALSRYKTCNESIKQLQAEQARIRKRIHAYVLKHGTQEYEGSKCYIQDRSKVFYDMDKLKQRLGKRVKSFLDDELTFDTSYFLSVCRENGIDRHLFMEAGSFSRKQVVNEKRLSDCIDKNEISLQDLEGCYTIEENSSLAIRLQ